jgi:hypothetical protein
VQLIGLENQRLNGCYGMAWGQITHGASNEPRWRILVKPPESSATCGAECLQAPRLVKPENIRVVPPHQLAPWAPFAPIPAFAIPIEWQRHSAERPQDDIVLELPDGPWANAFAEWVWALNSPAYAIIMVQSYATFARVHGEPTYMAIENSIRHTGSPAPLLWAAMAPRLHRE